MDVTRVWHNLVDDARMHEYSCKCICSQVVRPSVSLHSHTRVSVCVYLYIYTRYCISARSLSLSLSIRILHTQKYISRQTYIYTWMHHMTSSGSVIETIHRSTERAMCGLNWEDRGFIMSFARLTCFPIEDQAAKPVRHSWPGHHQRRRRLSSIRS